jgi:hypothetical protein
MPFLLVLVIRLIAPLSILRWPFWGFLLALAADAADVVLFEWLGWSILEGKGVYHEFDKLLDIYYLALAVWVTRHWGDSIAKKTALVLFSWRLLGVILFELTQIRQIILFTPSIFENFYLLAAGIYYFFPRFKLDNKKKIFTLLLIGGIPKLVQEYIMHFKEFSTWLFIKNNILQWK